MKPTAALMISLALLLSIAAIVQADAPQIPKVPISIVNLESDVVVDTWCVSGSGSFYCFHGEISNQTGKRIDSVRVTARGRDTYGSVIWIADAALPSRGAWSEHARVQFQIIEPEMPEGLWSVEFSITWKDAGNRPVPIELDRQSEEIRQHPWGVEVVGEVRNDTQQTVYHPKVTVAAHKYIQDPPYYNVRGVGWAYADTDKLEPGEICAFSVPVEYLCEIPQSSSVTVVGIYAFAEPTLLFLPILSGSNPTPPQLLEDTGE